MSTTKKAEVKNHVTQIKVTGLNNALKYTIPCHESGITLITGPNGYGKTSVIRLLDGVFSLDLTVFRQIPFETFEVRLSSGSRLVVRKSDVRHRGTFAVARYDGREKVGEEDGIPLAPFDARDEYQRSLFQEEWESRLHHLEITGRLERVGIRRYRTPDGELLTTEAAVRRYFGRNIHPEDVRQLIPDWFREVIEPFNTDFLNAQRLHASSDASAVDIVAKLIREDIQAARNNHSDLSQKIDRKFPHELLTQKKLKRLTPSELETQMKKLSEEWERFTELTLLSDAFDQPPVVQASELKRQIAGAYLRGLEKKLKAFEEIEPRMSLFRALINEHFELGKRVTFSRERGIEIRDSAKRLVNLNRLSSGEQHLLVLFGRLLFGTQRPSLVLIDEPELSLHPSWQLSFLSSIERIKAIAKVDFILATHAPALVAKHEHLMFDMWEAQNGRA